MIGLLFTHKNGCGGVIYVTGGKLRRADLKKWRVSYRIGLYTKLDRNFVAPENLFGIM